MSRLPKLDIRPITLAVAAATALATPQARAANIITFDDNANNCGGAVMCSPSPTTGSLPTGTQGYLNNGSGVAFDLSTINQWFQIDTNGVSHLANQPAEPDNGAGGFRVVNDTGSAVTSFSLTLTDFLPSPSASFQAQHGTGASSGTETLSGPDILSCSTATLVGTTCDSSGANATAIFSTPGTVTYTWDGLNIGAGTFFDITFSSWSSPAVLYRLPRLAMACQAF